MIYIFTISPFPPLFMFSQITLRPGKKKIDLSKLTDEDLRKLGIDPTLSKKEIAKLLKVNFMCIRLKYCSVKIIRMDLFTIWFLFRCFNFSFLFKLSLFPLLSFILVFIIKAQCAYSNEWRLEYALCCNLTMRCTSRYIILQLILLYEKRVGTQRVGLTANGGNLLFPDGSKEWGISLE